MKKLFPIIAIALPCFAQQDNEEKIIAENPSPIVGKDAPKINNLISQVGRPVVTEKEKEMKRKEEERLSQMEAKERAKEEARLARISARKSGDIYPPKECAGYSGTETCTIQSGMTLGKIGSEVYGNSAFSTLISVFNKKPANKLFIGEQVATPSPYKIFTELEGKAVWERYPYAIRDCLKVQEDFKKLTPTIIKEKASKEGYSEETKAKLDEMIWLLDQVKRDFFEKVEGINEIPVSATTQLHSSYTNLKSIRAGDLGTKNLRIQRVHLYLINGYSYALAWGRDGFVTKKK